MLYLTEPKMRKDAVNKVADKWMKMDKIGKIDSVIFP